MEIKISPVPFTSGKLAVTLDRRVIYMSSLKGDGEGFLVTRGNSEELVADCVSDPAKRQFFLVPPHLPLATIYFPGSESLPWLRLEKANDQIVYSDPSGVLAGSAMADRKMALPALGILSSSFVFTFKADLDDELSPERLDRAIAVLIYRHYANE